MKTLNVQAIEHTDIRGKKQKYIIIGDVNKNVVINVGEKTFNSVKEITEEHTPLEEPLFGSVKGTVDNLKKTLK